MNQKDAASTLYEMQQAGFSDPFIELDSRKEWVVNGYWGTKLVGPFTWREQWINWLVQKVGVFRLLESPD